jgi:hypothetical protein
MTWNHLQPFSSTRVQLTKCAINVTGPNHHKQINTLYSNFRNQMFLCYFSMQGRDHIFLRCGNPVVLLKCAIKNIYNIYLHNFTAGRSNGIRKGVYFKQRTYTMFHILWYEHFTVNLLWLQVCANDNSDRI